jgi:hypothetical protein
LTAQLDDQTHLVGSTFILVVVTCKFLEDLFERGLAYCIFGYFSFVPLDQPEELADACLLSFDAHSEVVTVMLQKSDRVKISRDAESIKEFKRPLMQGEPFDEGIK